MEGGRVEGNEGGRKGRKVISQDSPENGTNRTYKDLIIRKK